MNDKTRERIKDLTRSKIQAAMERLNQSSVTQDVEAIVILMDAIEKYEDVIEFYAYEESYFPQRTQTHNYSQIELDKGAKARKALK
jgi:hypothetical protein